MKSDLATAKIHLRVTDSAEDALITSLLGAAYLSVEGQIFRKVYETGATIPVLDATGMETNEAINAAALLIVGHLYNNRENTVVGLSVAELPMGALWLLTPYINHAGGD